MLIFKFNCELSNGIHARPASELEQRTAKFKCAIVLINHTKHNQADAKSVLSLISANITQGDQCELTFNGSDEVLALQQLSHFINHEFIQCDEPLMTIAPISEMLPVYLAQLKLDYLLGVPVSPGIGQGKLVSIERIDLHEIAKNYSQQNKLVHNNSNYKPQILLNRQNAEQFLLEGIEQLALKLIQQMVHADTTSKAVLDAHLKILQDIFFKNKLLEQLDQLGSECNLVEVIANTSEQLQRHLLTSHSQYLQERALDIEDICIQLVQQLIDSPINTTSIKIAQESIIIATNLTPSQLLALPRHLIKGIVLMQASATSHTVILARSFSIPILSNINNAFSFSQNSQILIVDAIHGVLIRDPNEKVKLFYQLEQDKIDNKARKLEPFKIKKSKTSDGVVVELAANIGIAQEAKTAFEAGAEGIGLFRTEMLFMARNSAPSEEEQYQIYSDVLQQAQGRRVIIRTFDIGGDKSVSYLNLAEEENPFLGYRAVRLYPEFLTIFHQQINALLRASIVCSDQQCDKKPLDIMIPMIATLEEVQWVSEQVKQCEQKLISNGIPVGQWRLGMMAEVPSVLYFIDKIKPWFDFISIGSNDLCQYFMACDRGNKNVASLYSYMQPSFIAMLSDLVNRAKKSGLETGLCGEMGADLQSLPLLVAIGLDEISMSSSQITKARQLLARLSVPTCKEWLAAIINASGVSQVKDKLTTQIACLNKMAILSIDLVFPQIICADKAEVIRKLTNNLEVHDRISNSTDVERAIWNREQIFSTALGFSVAIPHCKSPHVHHNSISVAHLEKPIYWSEDEPQVTIVIMLTINENDAQGDHMKIFSSLARLLMHSDFRAQLSSAKTAERIVTLLQEHIIS